MNPTKPTTLSTHASTTSRSVPTLRGVERTLNRLVGRLAGLGWTPADYVQLQVRGRKSGRFFSTAVNPLDLNGARYLVAPRGETQWVKNALAAGEVTLQHGRNRQRYALRLVPVDTRAPLLAAYLTRYRTTVQRFFRVPAGADPSAFEAIAAEHPVFRLTALS